MKPSTALRRTSTSSSGSGVFGSVLEFSKTKLRSPTNVVIGHSDVNRPALAEGWPEVDWTPDARRLTESAEGAVGETGTGRKEAGSALGRAIPLIRVCGFLEPPLPRPERSVHMVRR